MKRLFLRAAMMTILSSACFVFSAWSEQTPEAVPGEYVVKLKDEYSLKHMNKGVLKDELGAFIQEEILDQNILVVRKPVFQLEKSAVKELKNNPMVEIAEPNFIYRANAIEVNDPQLSKLWGLINTGQKDPKGQQGVAGIDIGAAQAWEVQTGSKDVVVAVIDTGIKYDHADLVDNVWTNEAEANGKPDVDDDNNGYVDDIHGFNFVTNKGDPMDDHGHGSHCSGTIGAKGNDGKGIVGVAWNTRIMGVKFLDKNGSGSLANALKAIDYATKNGAKIMSNSWGGGGFSETLKAAIERSHAAGALFVAAAGNESNNNDAKETYPGSYNVPNVLAVAAIDNKGAMASFSSYGKNKVHVGAPGVNVYSSTTNGYDTWSGTSMATPHVSGIAVLLASQFPNMTNVELKERIVSTAKPLASLRGKTKSGGMANAYTALMNIVPEPDANDPSRWPAMDAAISTAHPYEMKAEQSWEIRKEGAKEMSLYFSKFKTETRFDTVTLLDEKGNTIQVLSGGNDDTFSNTIPGGYVKIVFKADDSVADYGFDITKVAFR